MSRADDERWMARCLELARRAEGRTAPNPLVGCVIVKGGEVLAEGWHHRPGEAHGEADALGKIAGRAPGATLYVNLEPCAHRGRTEPCAPAVLAAGVSRVVIGILDPIRGHGGGARWLEKQGVNVTRGVLEDECRELNRGFLSVARRGRPWFTLKAAITLDGRVATRAGESRWITGTAARRDGHLLRDRLDAMMVGIGTVLADDPRMTVRGVKGGRNPVRVVVDSRLRTPVDAKLLRGKARAIIACSEAAPKAREKRLAAAEVWRLPGDGKRVDLTALARRLGQEGINSVLVEGGAELHAGLLDAGLVDELVLYVAPLVFGGDGAPAWAGGAGVGAIAEARRFRLHGEPVLVGDDLRVTYRPR